MAFTIEQTDHIEAYNEALAKAQAKMRHAEKDGTNPHFSTPQKRSRYATLASVIEAIREPLSSEGISFQQFPGSHDQGQVCITRFAFKDQWVQATMPILGDIRGMQAIGSAYTYARRYSLMMLAGVAADDDDDDGEGAEGRGGSPLPGGGGQRGQKGQQHGPPSPDEPKTLEQAVALLEQRRAATKDTNDLQLADQAFAAFVEGYAATLTEPPQLDALSEALGRVRPRGKAEKDVRAAMANARVRLGVPVAPPATATPKEAS